MTVQPLPFSLTIPRRYLFSCLLLCASLLALPAARAQAIAAEVDLNGAGPLTALLVENLEIRRHAADADLTLSEFERLYAAAPRQMRDLLATEGYFSPVIAPTLRQQGARWVAQFQIDPGPSTRIAAVELRFTGAIAEGTNADPQRIDRLRSDWSLPSGQNFRQLRWDEAKSNLLKGLLIRDFPSAKIASSAAVIDPKTHQANLSVEVDSGPAFTFGALQIEGLQRYSREIIEALNPIRPGDAYSQEKLTELQARLQDSGYFRTVFATIEVDPAQPQGVPVRLDLTENQRRRLSLGGGFSTDGGARLQVKWLDRRFLDHDWLLEGEARIDRLTRVLGGDLYFPARASGWRPSLGSHFERTDIANEVNDRLRIDARYTSPSKFDEQVTGISYLTDRQKIADAAPNDRHALIATYGYTRRRLDSIISPSQGTVVAGEVSGGPRGLLNEANLARLYGRAVWLSRATHQAQLLLRAQVGQVFGPARDRVPGELLFRAGGDQSVRGYAFNSLGVEQNGAIVGGRVMSTLSAELIYNLTPAWGAAVFHDAGNAADSWKDFKFQHGSGVGARWRSPIGPVNIDIAYGHATHTPRLHFWVGYGF
jgi:translocation and assembly module TamA